MSNEKWMSDDEWASWMGDRVAAAPVVVPVVVKKKKATQNQLNLALLEFCSSGNYDSAMGVIEEGANVNARTRANPGDSALTLAIEAGHENLALELIRRGAFCAPSRWHRSSSDSDDFDKSASSGLFNRVQKEKLGEVAVRLFIQSGSTWQALVTGRDLCVPSQSNDALLAQAFRADRFDLALQAAKAGVPMSANVWNEAEKTFEHRYSGLKDHRRRKEFFELISERGRIESMSVSVVKKLYRSAFDGDDAELMKALLDARLRPGADWSVDKRLNYYDKQQNSVEIMRRSIVWEAAKLASPEMLRLLKSCAPAMAAARTQKEAPESMELCPIGRVMELMESGVPIDAVSSDGDGLAHIWAKRDREPRDGWATLARKAPEVFSMKNKAGRCGHELMAEKLNGEQKDEFLAALSRIETREIKRDVAPMKQKAGAPKPKRL